jgi:hypothetical protein
MDYDDDVVTMICYLIIYVSTCAINWFLLSVQDSCQVGDADGIDGPPWTLDRVREWTVYGLSFLYFICDISLVYCDVDF